jgi:glycosyltransferase involved in cell wall biosynthesis
MKVMQLVIGGDVAGGQLVAERIARAAHERGDEVEFVSPAPGPFTERLDFPVHYVDVGRTFRAGGARKLARVLRGADVLHTHTLAAANVLSRVAARSVKVPVVAHLHIENHFRPATAPVLRRLDSATARACAALVAVSEDTRRAYLRHGYPDRIEVVYNGVDLPPAPGTTVFPGENGRARIGEVARLCDVKGQRELIQALAELPDVELVLAGEDLEQGGAFRELLEREAERLGVRDRVELTGRRDDVPELLDGLDLYVLPSWTEGLPLTVLEAMARGRAVVATHVGGTPELVVDGETGLLVPARDPVALAAAIRALLADPERRRAMGEAGRRRVAERFSAAAMTDRMLAVYDEVAG